MVQKIHLNTSFLFIKLPQIIGYVKNVDGNKAKLFNKKTQQNMGKN